MLNKVQLIGRIGKDIAFRSMTNGNKVASFSIATSEKWKDKNTGEEKETTYWHNIVSFTAISYIEYMKKGDLIYVEGKLTNRKYTDNQGVEKYITEIQLQDCKILNSGSGEKSFAKPVKKEVSKSVADTLDDDEIPF